MALPVFVFGDKSKLFLRGFVFSFFRPFTTVGSVLEKALVLEWANEASER